MNTSPKHSSQLETLKLPKMDRTGEDFTQMLIGSQIIRNSAEVDDNNAMRAKSNKHNKQKLNGISRRSRATT